MVNALPIIGWILSFVGSVSMAIPFWFLWTAQKFGEKYFYFLPDLYKSIPFWDCVGLFIVLSILRAILLPRFASSNTNNSKK